MKRILVTGGSGFIGSFIAEAVANEGHNVVIFDIAAPDPGTFRTNVQFVQGDIRFYDEVEAVFRGGGFDEVYDVAGELGTSEMFGFPGRSVATNIQGAVNVLEACRRHSPSAKIFHPTKPNDWLNPYSITKNSAEQFCRMYREGYGMSVAVLRWFNAYGPRQHVFPVRKAVPTMILQALYGFPLTIYGDGEQTMDLIHVKDIADIAIHCCRNFGNESKVMDVGCGDPITVNQFARDVIRLTKSSSTLKHLPMRQGEPMRSDIRADIVALTQKMDVRFREYEAGLRETIDWYAKNTSETAIESLEYLKAT